MGFDLIDVVINLKHDIFWMRERVKNLQKQSDFSKKKKKTMIKGSFDRIFFLLNF